MRLLHILPLTLLLATCSSESPKAPADQTAVGLPEVAGPDRLVVEVVAEVQLSVELTATSEVQHEEVTGMPEIVLADIAPEAVALSSCGDIFDCLGDCDPNDPLCFDDCISAAPEDVQEAFQDYYDCISHIQVWWPDMCWAEHCPEGEGSESCDEEALFDCLNPWVEECKAEEAACFPAGDWSCKETWACLTQCDDDADCAQDCLAELSEQAEQLWMEFIDCLDDEGYFECFDLPEEEHGECHYLPWTTCSPQLAACASAEGTCAQLWECATVCQPLDYFCISNCALNATPEAQQSFWLVHQCLFQQCGPTPSDQCTASALQDACAQTHATCSGT